MGILPRPGIISKGRVLFTDPGSGCHQTDLTKLDVGGERYRHLRGSRLSMIFQEPMTSLSPLHTIGDQIGETLRIHTQVSRSEERESTEEMLGLVGFPKPKRAYGMYPF